MKKRFGFIVAALLTATCAFAQTIEPSGDKGDKNILNHLDGSITLGTTGVGVDLAMPIGKMVQVRTGFNFFPHYEQTMHFGVPSIPIPPTSRVAHTGSPENSWL